MGMGSQILNKILIFQANLLNFIVQFSNFDAVSYLVNSNNWNWVEGFGLFILFIR